MQRTNNSRYITGGVESCLLYVDTLCDKSYNFTLVHRAGSPSAATWSVQLGTEADKLRAS